MNCSLIITNNNISFGSEKQDSMEEGNLGLVTKFGESTSRDCFVSLRLLAYKRMNHTCCSSLIPLSHTHMHSHSLMYIYTQFNS